MADADVLKIMLTHRERELILRYGYPFDDIERQLKQFREKRGRVRICDEPYWWEQVVGNLSISINEDVQDRDLLEELDELCNALEWHLQSHDARTRWP